MTVTIYSTPTCPYCQAAKQFFIDNDIGYLDIDVSIDEERAHEAMEKSGQMGVPVIDVNGEIVVGFNRDRLKQLLGLPHA